METHLPNKFLHAHRKSHVTAASISCYGRSEKPEESLSSKYFCIIVLHDCVPKHQHPPPNTVTAFIVSSARSEPQVIYIIYENDYIQWFLLYS